MTVAIVINVGDYLANSRPRTKTKLKVYIILQYQSIRTTGESSRMNGMCQTASIFGGTFTYGGIL
jgi:hypothetical protein